MEEKMHSKIDRLPNELNTEVISYLLSGDVTGLLAWALTCEKNYYLCQGYLQQRISFFLNKLNIYIENKADDGLLDPPFSKRRKTQEDIVHKARKENLRKNLIIYINLKIFYYELYSIVITMVKPAPVEQYRLENFLRSRAKTLSLVESAPYGYSVNFIASVVFTYLNMHGIKVDAKDLLGRKFDPIVALRPGAVMGCVNSQALLAIWELWLRRVERLQGLDAYKEKTITQLWFLVFNPNRALQFQQLKNITIGNNGWYDALVFELAANENLYNAFVAKANITWSSYHPVTVLLCYQQICTDEALLKRFDTKIKAVSYFGDGTPLDRGRDNYSFFYYSKHILTIAAMKMAKNKEGIENSVMKLLLELIQARFYECRCDFLKYHDLFVNWAIGDLANLFKQMGVMKNSHKQVLACCYNVIRLTKSFSELKAAIEIIANEATIGGYLNFEAGRLASLEQAENTHIGAKSPVRFNHFLNAVININHLISACQSQEEFKILCEFLFEERICVLDDKVGCENNASASKNLPRLNRTDSVDLRNVIAPKIIVCLLWVPLKIIKCITMQGDFVKLVKEKEGVRKLLSMSYSELKALTRDQIQIIFAQNNTDQTPDPDKSLRNLMI